MTGHERARIPGALPGGTSEFGELLLEMTGRVRTERARGLTATIVFRTDRDAWTVRFVRGRMTIGHGLTERPDTVVTADARTLLRIHTGQASGVDEFLAGRVIARGNLGLALRLESLFEPIGGRPVGALDEQTIRLNGTHASVMTAGQGEPVLLLHGLGATKASFLTTARALSDRYRVIVPDLPGHGDSAKPAGPYDPPFYARFVIKLMDALGIQRAHFVGNSLGGRISAEMALRHPERVRGTALLCPAVAWTGGRQAVPLVRMLRPRWASLPARVPRALLIRGMKRLFARPERLPHSWYDAGADEFLRLWREPRARVAIAASMRGLYLDEPWGKRGFWTRLSRLERPALFIWGDSDPLVPARFAEMVHRVLPGAQQVILDECGHVPQFELPERTHAHLLDFLATAERRLSA